VLWGFQLWWIRPLVLLVSSRGLPNLLVPLPGVLPAGGLGVVVDVVVFSSPGIKFHVPAGWEGALAVSHGDE